MPPAVIHAAQALLPDGWARDVRISSRDGVIDAVAPGSAPQAGDARVAIAVPGLANLHSHAFQRAMAGLSEIRGPATDSFWTWRTAMYRFAGAMGPDEAEAIAAQAYVEMLEAGFTRVGEFHYLHHAPDGGPYADIAEMAARIAAAAGQSGIGLTLLPVFYAHAGFGGAAPMPEQRRFVTTLDHFPRLLENSQAAIAGLPGAVLGVAPHSLRAATPDELAAVVAMTAGPVHIHVAEQTAEVDACLAWSGARPVEWLLDHAAPDARWCLIHATHMTEMETARLARSGAVAGLCPVTEANLGDGIFPLTAFCATGGRFGVGTDSNVLIGAAEELRLLEYGQRLSLRARNLTPLREGQSTGRALFDAALSGGAQALGARGGFAEGAEADVVSLCADHPAMASRAGDALLDAWIFAGGKVDAVWRRGRQVVSGGRHVAREAVAGRFARAIARLTG